MAGAANSFIDDSKHSDISCASSLSKVHRSEEHRCQESETKPTVECDDGVVHRSEEHQCQESETKLTVEGTPVRCQINSSAGAPVNGNSSAGAGVGDLPLQSSACDCQSVITHVAVEPLSTITAGHCDSQQEVTTNCSALHCQAAAAAAVIDDDKAITGSNIAVNGDEEDVSDACKAAGNNAKKNMATDSCHLHTSFTVESVSEEMGCVDIDSDCCPSPIDVTGGHCGQPLTTDSLCEQLSELMQRQCVNSNTSDQVQECVIGGSTSHDQVLNSTASDEVRECVIGGSTSHDQVLNSTASDEVRECVIGGSTSRDQVLNFTASDADVSDSFDLDAAAKDLERAVSAGMLDFLLESCEDSDEDVSSKQLCEGLGDWSDSSECTLTDDSCVVDETGDSDVWRRHERCLKNNDATDCDDDDDIDSVGESADDVDENAAAAESKNIVHGDTATRRDPGTSDIKFASDVNDNVGESADDADANGVGSTDALLKPCQTASTCLKGTEQCSVVDNTSTVDMICTCDDDDNDDVLRHARMKRRLQTAASDADDFASCRTSDVDRVSADINGWCVDVDNLLSHDENADSIDGSSMADDAAEFSISKDDGQLAVSKDTVSGCLRVSNDNIQDVKKMSSVAAERSQHDAAEMLNVTSSDVSLQLSVAEDADTEDSMELSDDTSLSESDGLGVISTSTPSCCSLLTCRSVMRWREGIYSGLCQHSDGSEIRM